MADIFQRAVPDGPMNGIPAETYNLMLDCIRDFMRRRTMSSPGNVQAKLDNDIQVQNESGGGLDQFAVVGVGSSVVGPSESDTFWFGDVVYSSASPTASGKFAILQRPAAEDDIVPATLSGVTLARISIAQAGDGYAAPVDADYEKLTSQASSGPATLFWHRAPDAWSGATAYIIGDTVVVGGAYYTCKLGHTNHTPPNGTYWTLGATCWALVLLTGGLAGLTSINSQTGPAITLESLDGSIVIENPSPNVLDLHACPISSSIAGIDAFPGPGMGEWTVPPCVTQVLVECFGAGGSIADVGGTGLNPDTGFGGHGGGAYAASLLTVAPGDLYLISTPGPTGDSGVQSFTQFQDSEGGAIVSAENGWAADESTNAGGLPGHASASIGTTKHSGGTGGSAFAKDMGGDETQIWSGGGGGGAGPNGDGSNGTNGIDGRAGVGGNGYSVGGDGGYFDVSTLTNQVNADPFPFFPATNGTSPGGAGGGENCLAGGVTIILPAGVINLPFAGYGMVRITWGPGVNSINSARGTVTLQSTDGDIEFGDAAGGSVIQVRIRKVDGGTF